MGWFSPPTLTVGRYRFHWRVSMPLSLPPYAASTLRGVFGWALRELSCVTRAPDCAECRLIVRCPYARLFESQKVALTQGMRSGIPVLTPYSIETPFNVNGVHPVGESFSFDLVLMTPDAVTRLPLIISAWKRAFARGTGNGSGRAVLVSVDFLPPEAPAVVVYRSDEPTISQHEPKLTAPCFRQAADVTLHIETPLRIEQKGKLLGAHTITPAWFLRHLIRRVSFYINSQHPAQLPLEAIHQLNAWADAVNESNRMLKWVDWDRYSTRQNRRITLGGIVGHWQLLSVPPSLLTFLYLGQWFHVGKESAFGLGKYNVAASLPESHASQTQPKWP